MKVEVKKISVRDLFEKYENKNEGGVVGYGGKLNIRPKYQREFIYKDKERDLVIDTVFKGLPLGMMHWAVREDETLEVIDGQQRLMSICEYLSGNFSVRDRFTATLTDEEQEEMLDYEIYVSLCEGTERETLEWFRRINVVGSNLTNQELLNINYTGDWLTDAKARFSRSGCQAGNIAKKYLKGSAIRQEYLETALKWAADIDNDTLEEYMGKSKLKKSAIELWNYFESVINWTNAMFPNYRKEMKGVGWGYLYNKHKDLDLSPRELEAEIKVLMMDEDVTNKKGIYNYVLDKDQRHLNIRAFSANQKREMFEKQKGVCTVCKESFELDEMEADHITPWSEGGKTSSDNCQMLCKKCNRTKSTI